MMNRSKTQKDILSRIKHENTRLGAGTEMGGVPNNQGLSSNAFQPPPSQPQQHPSRYPAAPPSGDNSYNASLARTYESQSAGLGRQTDAHADYRAYQHTADEQPGAGHIVAATAQFHKQQLSHSLGAGPSFVSLSPSDSISNFEGRPGNYHPSSGAGGNGGFGAPHSAAGGALFEPSAASTASFAQGQSDAGNDSGASTPLRPARSGRRPQRMSVMSTASVSTRGGGDTSYGSAAPAPVGRNLLRGGADRSGGSSRDTLTGGGGLSDSTHAPPLADRHAKSARLMAQVNNMPDSGRETPASMISEDEEGGGGDAAGMMLSAHRPGDGISPTSPPLGSLTQQSKGKPKAALESVLSALSQAGRKQGQARMLRGTTAEEESRRRRVERKAEAARSRVTKPLEAYIDRADSRAFQGISAVLHKAKAEWDFVVDDDFNSVALAFSLLDDSSLGTNRAGFEEMKGLIEHSLQGTVDDHYESFATAISRHNNVLSSLTTAQGGVSGARRRLRDAREALGAKRADLVQLWHRSQSVKESLRLLDTIDNLKGVPDRLESLMAEKQFLEAVNLLTHALKICEKAEVVEVGATSDLRGYLKGQEQAMFDILIEELHNHLYLKSYFCDARWKPYTPGQSRLPNVEFGRDYEEASRKSHQGGGGGGGESDEADSDANAAPSNRLNGGGAVDERLKLFQYLNALSKRPAPDANMAGDMLDMGLANGVQHGATSNGDTGGMPRSNSVDSVSGAAGGTASSGGANGGGTRDAEYQQQNPETDSFLYIEMLLEALAKLGKLKLTHDVILQRLPVELHQLVDATIEEVAGRSEMMRRSSVAIVRPESLLLASSSALARSFAENARNSFRSSFSVGQLSASGRSAMRLSTLESSQVERDCETMRDLFWTLFSKLDAVLQGHRVVFEVTTRIASRGASSAYKAVKIGKPSSLTDVWRPIQVEVRTLLHEHLVDESESNSARRNAIVSVNEVLRQGSFQRDRSKPLYHLTSESAPRPGAANLSRKDFAPLRRHEEALTNALRASVPGLVGGPAVGNEGAGVAAAIFQQQQQQRAALQQHQSSSRIRTGFSEGAGHKLLVKPDAFNISVLFQPALAFIERVKLLLPPEAAGRTMDAQTTATVSNGGGAASTGFSRFLDEFVRDVFLSQLEDKVQSLFATAVAGSDAFQEDSMHKSRTYGRPIVRSVANVIVLIDSLYAMLRTTPFHRESYSLLIIQTIVQYYQRCYDRFRDLVTHDSASGLDGGNASSAATSASSLPAVSSALSALWAQRPELSNCLTEMVDDGCAAKRKQDLIGLENSVELRLASTLRRSGARAGTVSARDLTASRKKLTALGNLFHSLLWFQDHIAKLKATDQDTGAVSTTAVARLSLVTGSLTTSAAAAAASAAKEDEDGQEEESYRLPLSAELVPRFEALPNTYKHLAHLVLFTLRLEVRARTIHHLDLAIVEGNYLVEDAVLEPDPHIVDLNAELASLDDVFADTILPQYHRFLFDGLASLMDLQLCRAIRKVRFVNRHGLTKMIRNIMALQQNLRNIVVVNEAGKQPGGGGADASEAASAAKASAGVSDGFERSRKLWELVGKEPDELLATIRTTGAQHAFDDYHSALKLMLGLENAGPAAATSTTTAKASTPSTPAGQGPLPPGAHLRPGTSAQAGSEMSRQKINEYLIELHEVAGEAL